MVLWVACSQVLHSLQWVLQQPLLFSQPLQPLVLQLHSHQLSQQLLQQTVAVLMTCHSKAKNI